MDGVMVIDGNSSIISANAAIVNIFGYREEELVGHNIAMLMPEPQRCHNNNIIAQFQSPITGEFIETGQELVGLTKQGSEVLIKVSLIELSSRRPRQFVMFVRKTIAL